MKVRPVSTQGPRRRSCSAVPERSTAAGRGGGRPHERRLRRARPPAAVPYSLFAPGVLEWLPSLFLSPILFILLPLARDCRSE